MKKIIILLLFSFMSFSCEKENLVPATEIPNWLKDRIAQDEKDIESGNRPDLENAALVRFIYLENYYFEYHNLVRSSLYQIYDWDGKSHPFNQEELTKYEIEKCCKQYPWKGSSN